MRYCRQEYKAFNSNRRIAGKWKEGEAIAEAVEDPNFDSKLDLIT